MARVETLLKIATYLCALSGFAAVLRYLDSSYIACFASFAAIALFIDFRKTIVLPRWLLNILSIFVLIPSAFRIGPESIVEPVLNGLVLLMGIKLLEDKKPRDYMQIYLICIFLLIGSSLISFSIVFLFYFFCLFSLCTLSLMLLCYFTKSKDVRISADNIARLLSQSLLICGISLPACVLFFLILPRTDFPLFGFLNKASPAKSGFSDSVSLGDVAEIQEDSRVAFRAEMDEVSDSDLYWRGIELDLFDGKSWKRSPLPTEMPKHIEGGREGYKKTSQTIYLEPYGNRYLFALDRPVAIYPEKVRHWKNRTVWKEDIQERIRYRALSVATGFASEKESDPERYLQLPVDFSPRIVELSKKLAAGGTGLDAVRNFMHYFRSGFEYSLKNLPESASPLEDFIFESRHGNCEYFASALAAMLRSAGIPARLVGGYRGGYYNRAGNYYLVLQKHAHVWVEAYCTGGWMRLDPTPITPLDPGTAYRAGILLRVDLLLDTINYYWEKSVISYDLNEQFALWRKLRDGIRSPTPDFGSIRKSVSGLLVYILPLCFILPGVILLFRLSGKPEEKLASRFVRRMEKRGYGKGTGEGLEEFVERIGDPDLRRSAARFVAEYQDVFYRDQKFSHEQIKRLKSCIREL